MRECEVECMKNITLPKFLVYTQDFVVCLTDLVIWLLTEFLDKS